MDSRPKGGGPHRQGYIRFATQPTSPTHQRCLRLYHRAVGLWSTHWYLFTTSLGDVAFVYNIVLIWWFPVRGPTRVTKANQLSLNNQRLSKPPLQADVNPLSGGSLTHMNICVLPCYTTFAQRQESNLQLRYSGGTGGIRTLARCYPTKVLAGPPLIAS